MRLVRHWNRSTKEVVDATSLGVFNSRLNGALSNLIPGEDVPRQRDWTR